MICEKIIRKKVYCLNLHRKLKIDEDIDKGENLLVESHWLEYIYIHTHTTCEDTKNVKNVGNLSWVQESLV